MEVTLLVTGLVRGHPQLPGTMAYGDTSEEAVSNVQALGLRALADRIEHGEAVARMTRDSGASIVSGGGTGVPPV